VLLRRAAMHAALLGDLPVAGAGVKPLLQWQEAHRRRLMGSTAGARRPPRRVRAGEHEPGSHARCCAAHCRAMQQWLCVR